VKILFAALHLAYFRNFDSVVRELAARGHHVHLTGDEPEAMGGQGLAETLAAEHPGRVTWDLLPSLEDEPWFDAARRMRVSLDYVRGARPAVSRQAARAHRRSAPARVVRWASALPLVGAPVTLAALKRFERLMPAGDAMVAYLRRHAPDVVVLTLAHLLPLAATRPVERPRACWEFPSPRPS
jgi:hypothetical protein